MTIITATFILKPTKEQLNKFHKYSGTARFVYNACLSYKIDMYDTYGENLGLQDLIEYIRDLKYNSLNHSWLLEVPEAITKQSIKDLLVSYKNFFKGLARFPRYKKKGKSQDSFYQRTDKLKFVTETLVKITGVGDVKCKSTQDLDFTEYKGFKNPRVKFDGKNWVLTFGYEVDVEPFETSNESLGIDLGVKTLATLSNGVVYKGLKYDSKILKYERQLKRLQREYSRKYEANKGRDVKFSNNMEKIKRRIQLKHRKIRNVRKTYLHTITNDIVKTKPYRIVVEDLNVRGMLKNRHLSKAISRQSFNMFVGFLKYKSEFQGIDFIKADRFYPSSKLCSSCGTKRQRLSLSERIFICYECGNTQDRDLNASINLSNYNCG